MIIYIDYMLQTFIFLKTLAKIKKRDRINITYKKEKDLLLSCLSWLISFIELTYCYYCLFKYLRPLRYIYASYWILLILAKIAGQYYDKLIVSF